MLLSQCRGLIAVYRVPLLGLTTLAATEAVIGPFTENTFIATFTQRFFAR